MTHPTYQELTQVATRPEISSRVRHIEECGLCSLTLASIRGETSNAEWELGLVSKRSEELPSPDVGQVWRLDWAGDTLFVLIVAVDEMTVDVLPIIEDPHLISGALATWQTEDSPVGFEASLWPGPRATIPLFVLDRFYSSMDVPEIHDGTAPSPISASGQYLIDAVAEQLEKLSAESWVSGGAAVDWDQALQARGFTYADLMDRLDLPFEKVQQLKKGGFDEETARLVSLLLGLPLADLPKREFPPMLLRALGRPACRPQLRQRAAAAGVDETELRTSLAGDLVTSHQRSEPGADPKLFWERVVDDYLGR